VSKIFISYRREDTAPYAGRLCDHLVALFGPENVFIDVQDIHPGQDFTQTIQETLAKCHALLAVIGPHWLEILKQREQAGEDFVQDEIAEALRRNLTVIPVLVDGVKMPDGADLPIRLQALSRHQAVEIRNDRFNDGFEQLATVLKATPGLMMKDSPARSKLGWKLLAAAALMILLAIVYVVTRPARQELNGLWMADMHKAGQPAYRVRLDLTAENGTVSGTVDYPTGRAEISGGTLAGSTLLFQTTHIPQFESAPATVRFQGEVVGTTIQLKSTDDNGIATGVATRTSSPALR
jgi:hypothetical protein